MDKTVQSQALKPKRKRALWVCVRIAIIVLVAIAFGLINGVWLPDLLFAARHVVARKEMPNGAWVEMIQYWHRPAKEYRTEIVVKLPSNQPEAHPYSQQLEKIWRWNANLELHADSVTASISRGGRHSSSRIYFHPSQRGKWITP
jgi:hypothetical protein